MSTKCAIRRRWTPVSIANDVDDEEDQRLSVKTTTSPGTQTTIISAYSIMSDALGSYSPMLI